MSLQPGTRIPAPHMLPAIIDGRVRAFYRGLVEGLTLGAVAGALLSACALALAWAHMGG